MVVIKDFLKMIRDIRSANKNVGIWGRALNMPQIVGGLVLIYTLEGAAIFFTVIGTLVIASQIHKRSPFSRLMGLCHAPWLVLAPWLFSRLQTVEYNRFIQVWLCYVVITMIISIVFDIYDLYQYLRGSQTFSWAA